MAVNNINQKFFIGVGILLVVLLLIYLGDKPSEGLNDEQVQHQLTLLAQELNSMTPMVVDGGTRLDNCSVLSNKRFRYSYTLTLSDKEDFTDSTYFDDFRERMVNQIKTTPEMKFCRNNNVTLQYSYYDRNGVFVIEFIITPDDYRDD